MVLKHDAPIGGGCQALSNGLELWCGDTTLGAMAFVRRRNTKSGGLSTALVESYRDASGRPRQRILANLYGAETPLEALAKLAAQRERLRKERAFRQSELDGTAEDYKVVTMGGLQGHRFTPQERKKIDRFLSDRRRVEARIKKIDSALARVQKEGVVVRKHCTASQAEIQTAVRRYKKQLGEAEAAAVVSEHMHDLTKKKLRRLSPFGAETPDKGLKEFLRELPL